ncbi:hypothetical protein CEP54_015993 [Fusarium duplospermum]|uniref:Transcription factor domain-containing protein n=1 Tax=Fusarium duplospermum TaxID=1325734 RepID=A0A428NJ74_9HYPO|nr:hypothetical protein CEP54_015993 [Fusarium duplospermum]
MPPSRGRRLGNVPEVERRPIVEEEQEQQQPPTNPQGWRDEVVRGRLQNHVTASHREDPSVLTRLSRIIAEGLSVSIKSELPNLSLGNITSYCIDLYMRFTFPTAPLIHEPTVRKDAPSFFSDAPIDPFETDSEHQQIARMKAFTLVTALCAMVASIMPESLLPYRDHITRPFLSASREMLSCFEIHDLDCPTAASLTIRMFQSAALQHATGKANAAFHVHGHAALPAQRLRLYSERSIEQYDALEGQLLRMNFWHLYASDMTAAALQSRPFTLRESAFDEPLTLKSEGIRHVSLLDPATLLIKKVEMVQDFMLTLEDIPVLYLQVKGEPHVERIRRLGAILLEFIQVVEDEHLQSRAKALLR